MAPNLFISYRRDDSAGYSGRVHDRLQREFGDNLLFMDVDSIPLGVNFSKVLVEEVAKCDVLLAVIGPGWLSTALDFSAVPAHGRPEVFGPFIRVTNSYNGLRALAFNIGFLRKVCKNGLILPDTIIRFKFTHMRRDIKETISFEVSHERLAKLKTSFGSYLDVLRACSVRSDQFVTFAHAVLSIRAPEELEPKSREATDWDSLTAYLTALCDRYARELGENAYAVLNVVTEFASHPPANRHVHLELLPINATSILGC